MKFFKSRAVAAVVLVLAILGASVYGLSKKPAELPDVEYYNWISDEHHMLTDSTEDIIESYNAAWNDRYYAVVAVAAVEHIRGWKAEDFVYDLGEKWGLGANDMLVLLVGNSDYYVGLGDNLLYAMTDTQQHQLQVAIDTDYYQGDFNAAVVSFFRQADVFYAQAMQNAGSYNGYDWVGSGDSGRVALSIFGILLVVAAVFLIWVMLDKARYNRYQRRVAVTPGIVYYPVFWGRPRRPAAPVPPVRPAQPTYRPSGGGYNPPRNHTTTTVRPNRPTTSRPTTNRANNRNSFGNGGFGGGSRSGSSRSGGSSRGGRGGFGGGRR